MILKELSQPSNYLISRLGLYNSWFVGSSYAKLDVKPTLATLFMQNFVRLVFKNGLIFLSHPFKNRLFTLVRGFFPLPRFFTVEDMYKFYRLHRVKAKLFKTYKTEFILRRVFRKIVFSSTRLYSFNSWLIILSTAHIPTFYKYPSALRKTKQVKGQIKLTPHSAKKVPSTLAPALKRTYEVYLLSSFFIRNC